MVEVVVVVFKGVLMKVVVREIGKLCFGFDFELKLRLMLGLCMYLIFLESLEEKLIWWKVFKVGVKVEIRGGEVRMFNDDEFMFGYKGKKKMREREIFKDD